MAQDFNFYDFFHLRVRGSGSLRKYFEHYYGAFADSTLSSESPDLTCHVEPVKRTARRVLGDPKGHYGREEDAFFIKEYGSKLVVPDVYRWNAMHCSPELPPQIARKVVESEIREQLAEEGFSLIHASSVTYQGRTYVMPAWRHTGKTNTMLAFLSRGASYLSDDRVWIRDDGTIFGYPLPVQMLQYNFDSFPTVNAGSALTSLRGQVGSALDDFLEDKNMRLFRGLDLINQHWVKERNTYRIEQLFPDAEYVPEDVIDRLVLLETTTDSGERLHRQALSADDAAQALSSINFHEWDKDLYDTATAFDILFPEAPSKRASVDDLVEHDREVFANVCDTTQTHRLPVPREERWHDENVSEALLTAITEA